MKTDIIASLEQLENTPAFKDFCEKLEHDWTETVKDKMKKSQKITAEDYARTKIYGSLAELPKKIRLALSPGTRGEKVKQDGIYETLEKDS